VILKKENITTYKPISRFVFLINFLYENHQDILQKDNENRKKLTQENIAKYLKDIIKTYRNKESEENVQIKHDDPIRLYYQDILADFLNLFTKGKYNKSQRMISLVNKKYDFMLKKHWKQPINFSSLTFKTKSRLKANIIGQNKNQNNDKITHFLQLGGYYNPTTEKIEQIDIPVKFDNDYHLIDKINDYKQTYTVKYNYLTKKIERFDLVIELETNVLEYNKEYIEEEKYVIGIDVNTKHNLMATSSRNIYVLPWDDPKYAHLNTHYKKKVLTIVDRKRRLEIKKKQNKHINESEYLYVSKSYENIKRRIKKEEEKLVSLMISDEIKKGTKCITYEDLNITNTGGIGSKYINHKNSLTHENDTIIKQERYNKLLDISSMKEKISRISTKKGLRSVVVPAPLTSITCNVCKFSHKDNRKEQEFFKCLICGYKENADFNSGDNIKSIYTNKHLKNNLLFYDEKIKNYASKKNLTISFIRQVYDNIG
jgi:hypothetical protein